MTTRPPIVQAPPDLPDPTLAAALTKGTGTRSLGDRRRWALTLAGGGLTLFAIPYGAWQCWRLGVDFFSVLWWACGSMIVALLFTLWIGLTLVQDVAQVVFMLRLWRWQLGTLSSNASARRSLFASFGAHVYKMVVPRQPVIMQGGRPIETVRSERIGSLEAEHAKLKADFLALAHQAQGSETTAHLPNSGPKVAEYWGGPAEILIKRLHENKSIAVNQLTEKRAGVVWMTRKSYNEARALLVQAGVLVGEGERVPLRLAPDLAEQLRGRSLAEWHQAVISRLEG